MPIRMEEEALGAIAMRWLKRLPVPSASGASPLSIPNTLLTAFNPSLTCLNICLLRPTACEDSHGIFFLCRYACHPKAPMPILRSRLAEYIALEMESGALAIKYSSTLSSISATSLRKRVSFFQSS